MSVRTLVTIVPGYGMFGNMTGGKNLRERGEMAHRAVRWLSALQHCRNVKWTIEVISGEKELIQSATYDPDYPRSEESCRATAILWERYEYFHGYSHACED